jgi:hypothetical protein
MTQDPDDDSSFTVANGEQVTVTLQSVKCNCNTSAAFDGTALVKQHSIPDVYRFSPAGNSKDEQDFAASCKFEDSDPETAHYTVKVEGSGGGSFTPTSIPKEAPQARFELHFTIS